MSARLDFNLDGAGWATLTITSGSFAHTIEAISYLTNALDDLLRMGLDIATDKGWSFAEFDHEGGQTILVAETSWVENDDWRHGARVSSINCRALNGMAVTWDLIRDAEREFVLPIESDDELAAIFLRAAQRVMTQCGSEGYSERWGGRLGFPIRAMNALEAALSRPAFPRHNYGASS